MQMSDKEALDRYKRPVRHLESGDVFPNARQAAIAFDLNHHAVNNYVLGVRQTPVAGHTFELIRRRLRR